MAGESNRGIHIYRIYIGTFFSIHFDTNEVFVKKIGNTLIFEGFVGHDMTPMTGGVTNRQKNRYVSAFGFGKGTIAPLPPVNRVGGVLLQVGASSLI